MYDAAARTEVVGTLHEILGKVNDLQAWKQAGANAARPQVYHRPDGLAAAIDVDEGFRHVFASGVELDNWRRLGLCSTNTIPVSSAQLDDLLAKANARLEQLRG